MDLPYRAEDLTPAWVTYALRAGGHVAEVVETQATPIGDGRGFASQRFRLVMRHADPSCPLPTSLVAKLPPRDDAERAANAAMWIDRKEVAFYRSYGVETPVRTPQCYFAGLDGEEGSGVLLLEDLGHTDVVEPLAACDAERAGRIVEAAARVHAHFWEDERLRAEQCLVDRLDGTYAALAKLLEGLWPAFVEYAGERMPGSVSTRHGEIAAALAALPQRIRSGASTLTHGDFWFGNLLFDTIGGAEHVVVLDWAMMSWALGASDLATFIGMSLPSAMRRRLEQTLLDRYHAELVRCGVHDYSMADLWEDYRLSLLTGLAMPVLESGGRIAQGQPVSDALLEAIAQANTSRLLEAIVDADALAVLS